MIGMNKYVHTSVGLIFIHLAAYHESSHLYCISTMNVLEGGYYVIVSCT